MKKSANLSVLLISVFIISAISLSAMAQHGKSKKKTELSATTTVTTKTSDVFSNSKSTSFQHEGSVSLSKGIITTSSGGTQFDIGADYHWLLKEKIQVGGQATIQTVSASGTSYTTTTIFALGTYNLDEDFSNAIFIRGGLGLVSGGVSGNSQTKIGFKAGAGKRFPLWDHFYYAPNASIQKLGDLDAQLEIMPVNFSVFY